MSAQELLSEYDGCLGVVSPEPRVPDPGSLLAAHLPAAGLALGAVAAVECAANRLREASGLAAHPVTLDPARVAASVAGDRMLRLDGEPVDGFAPLSGFFATADGWVRTHGNYPHHRRRLLDLLGLPEDGDRERVRAALAEASAQEVEDAAAEAGAIAVRVRDEHEWAASPPGRAARQAPLVQVATRGAGSGDWQPTDGTRPLAGLRVLDLTRVIAGPVATRTLALLGADVLRIDPPDLDEIAAQHLDNGQGKRTTRLDLRSEAGATTFAGLLTRADVLVTGYRPGALERLGLDAAAERPGLVRARVSAWGTTGPWASRRGFDSIVQAASGIALVEGAGSGRPGALPAQVLDHAGGYLLAAAVLDALTARCLDGCGRDVAVSLAGTAARLLAWPERKPNPRAATLPDPAATTVTHGGVTTARPALAGHDDYPWPARPWGADAPRWS